MGYSLSIIIPTCGRTRILRQCLDFIAAQTVKDIEVIVVSDGPDDKTAEMFQNLLWPFELQYFAIPKSHQGVARNRGAGKARSRLLLLIGDDIFLAPDACERHLKAHEKVGDKIAVLGFTTWDPSLKITPLMRWMEESGVQFGYPKIQEYAQSFLPKGVQHWFTYTSHLSLPSQVLYRYPFREDVFLYGWEDIEWGWRLTQSEIPLYFEPRARAYHHHPYSNEAVWERSKQLGKSAANMEKLVPTLLLVPHGWKSLACHVGSLLPTNNGKHWRAFLRGAREEKSPL